MGRLEEAIQQKSFKDPFNKAVVNILYTNSYIVTRQNKLFKPYEISPEQYNVLRILRGKHPDPITVYVFENGERWNAELFFKHFVKVGEA